VTVLGSATDPDGRVVELTEERWRHIIGPPGGAGHPELAGLEKEVLQAVEDPDRRAMRWAPNDEWFYLAGAGPRRWLKVVVIYEGQRGFIVTAYARRSFP
jgi:hypothetical protein